MPVFQSSHRFAGSLDCRGRALDLATVQLMGILNVTPDSFYDGGRHGGLDAALGQAALMLDAGAALIDVGGQSTRPGFVEISEGEELARIEPLVRALVAEGRAIVSIDTYKPGVAKKALQAGAHVLNDIHGLQGDPELAALACEAGASVVAMHFDPLFPNITGDLMGSMRTYFERTLEIAGAAGLSRERIVLDPGIGFHKTQKQNLEILARLGELHELGCALLIGASRKSVIAHVLDLPADQRLEGTLAITALAVNSGVQLLRVHDVRENLRVARMAEAIQHHRHPS